MWDPAVYLRHAGPRARPFLDLLARVDGSDLDGRRARIVDLGCGPGTLTGLLAQRWPAALVTGLDSSAEMIAEARRRPAAGSLDFAVADLRDYRPEGDIALLVANASLHWVPGHPDLLRTWAAGLPAGGQLAFQVPGNQDAPSHRAIRDVVGDGDLVTGAGPVLDPAGYAALLSAAGCAVDAWETTYLHRLPLAGDRPTAPHPVRTWLEGTTLRPAAAALGPAEWDRFTAALDERLAAAYPLDGDGVWFPFRRIFAVARRPR